MHTYMQGILLSLHMHCYQHMCMQTCSYSHTYMCTHTCALVFTCWCLHVMHACIGSHNVHIIGSRQHVIVGCIIITHSQSSHNSSTHALHHRCDKQMYMLVHCKHLTNYVTQVCMHCTTGTYTAIYCGISSMRLHCIENNIHEVHACWCCDVNAGALS